MDQGILNIIYQKRATMLLEDHCTSIELNFDKLNDLLVKWGGIVCGSLALSCFDNTFVPGDMDIFTFSES